jgi:hypothetical protein
MLRNVWCLLVSTRTRQFTLSLVVLFGLAGRVQASPIVVANPSFEVPVIAADGAVTNVGVVGWTLANAAFAFNPTAANATPTDGTNVLFLQATGSASQTLAAVLTANTLYSLLVDVGSRADFNFSFGYTVELLAGSTVLGTDNAPVPASGTWAQASIQYTALAGDPLLGQALAIRLTNVPSGSSTTLMDNVRLDGSLVQPPGPGPSTVPEPGTALLLISGMAARRFLRRRRA